MLSNKQPWASGPGEILKHSLQLLEIDSDVNRRLAMISVDNSVELMIKTYLGLPSRITGLRITRKEYDQISNTFPDLLDGLERHATNALMGINLGEIEWFHRLRNELYHEGNGLTVEREKVEIYAELAKLLFKNLFGFEINLPETTFSHMLYEFLDTWSQLTQEINSIHIQIHLLAGPKVVDPSPSNSIIALHDFDLIDQKTADRLVEIQRLREDIWLHQKNYRDALSHNLINEIKEYLEEIKIIADEVAKNVGDVNHRVPEIYQELNSLASTQSALREQMDKLKERIDRLESQEEVVCPLCGKVLSEQNRQSTISELIEDGKAMANQFRANRQRIDFLNAELNAYFKYNKRGKNV